MLLCRVAGSTEFRYEDRMLGTRNSLWIYCHRCVGDALDLKSGARDGLFLLMMSDDDGARSWPHSNGSRCCSASPRSVCSSPKQTALLIVIEAPGSDARVERLNTREGVLADDEACR
ncbi:hypothetical protein Nepgr_008008 [Nepenthes gracilis]|uniref:Uncharacterized protein n=1 Tax=Nepenthes gracilis TaxID=150966 RepID=A0AAD3S7X0_NEPGR|nr:hypothetical protein Nepgr_008008 [Nepenthes gracilis]